LTLGDRKLSAVSLCVFVRRCIPAKIEVLDKRQVEVDKLHKKANYNK
jgi:hypothetical protein